MSLSPTPYLAVFTAAWATALAFAVFVLAVRGRHRPSRGLGLFLLFFTMMGVTLGLSRMETDAAMAQAYLDVAFLTAIPTPFLLAHHVATFPRLRWRRHGSWGLAGLALPALALDASYIAFPGAWEGSIGAVEGAVFLATALTCLVFLRDFLREPAGPVREALFLVAAGWGSVSLVDGWWWTWASYHAPDEIYHFLEWAAGVFIVYVMAFVVVTFLRRRPAEAPPQARRRKRVFFAALAPAFLGSSVAALLYRFVSHEHGVDAMYLAAAAACAGGTLLLMYAAVKYQMLGLDLKVKWTVEKSTIAAVFAASFLVGGEALERLLGADSAILGIAVAGSIALVLRPVRRFADRVADALLPAAKPIGAMSGDERHALYRDQARFALADGVVTDKERAILEVARTRLGLSVEEARAIEHAAVAASPS